MYVIFGINTTRDISKINCLKFHSPKGSWNYISHNNFEISLVVFTPNITTNHAITYTNSKLKACFFHPCCQGNNIKILLVLTYTVTIWHQYQRKCKENSQENIKLILGSKGLTENWLHFIFWTHIGYQIKQSFCDQNIVEPGSS